MLKIIKGNLLLSDVPAIIHQCNCFCTMGGGIAFALSNKYPKVLEADNETKFGDKSKLGSFTYAIVSEDPVKYVINLYSQYDFGSGLQTDYAALKEGLNKALKFLLEKGINRVGLPYLIGCGLAGGDPAVVLSILDEVQKDNPDMDIELYKLERKERSVGKVRIGVKRLDPEAELPFRAHPSDAGADVKAVSVDLVATKEAMSFVHHISYGTGLAFDIPEGYWIDARARSSVFKTGLVLCNGVGTIDSNYTGEVKANFYSVTSHAEPYKKGDRIIQLIVMPNVSPLDVEFYEITELPVKDRGAEGFGSTGK